MILGIVAGKYLPKAGWMLILLCFVVGLLLYYVRKRSIYNIVIIIAAAIFSMIGYVLCTNALLPYELDGIACEGDSVILEGIVYRQEQKNGKTILYLNNSVISYDTKLIDSGVTILTINEEKIYYEGSHILADGTVSLFKLPRNEGEFDEAAYYRTMGVNIRVNAKEVEVDNSSVSRLRTALTVFRYDMKRSIDSIACERDSGVLKAMTLGEKSDINVEIKELYQMSGISHLISISGLHISIIGMLVYKVLRKLTIPIRTSAIISYIVMLMYGFITGFGVSTIRAIIMFFVMIGANIFGRTYCIYSSLSMAAIIILIDKPLYLFYSGFQLSFMAVLGISFFSAKGVLGKLLSGFGISIFTLPIILYSFFEIPLYSIVLNLIVIPMSGIVLVFGIISGICGTFCMGLGKILVIPSHLILTIYEKVCRLFMGLPYSNIILGRPSIWGIFLYYTLLIFIVFIIKSNVEFRKRLGIIIFTVLLMWNILCFRQLLSVQITFLDVGQGDCIFIRTKEDVNILLDGGSSGIKQVGKYKMLPYLKSQGIKRLDYVILSHPDNDHTNGFAELVESNYQIDNLLVADTTVNSDSYSSLLKLVKEHNIKITGLKKGDVLSFGDLKLNCLHPERNFVREDENEESLVIELEYDNIRGLFTGDISSDIEKILVSEISKGYEFLKVSHHGSKNSSSMEFLQRVSPKAAIISSGKNNKYGHPNDETLERLKKVNAGVYRTDNSGMITITIDDERVELTEFLG